MSQEQPSPDCEAFLLRRVHKSRCSEGQPTRVLRGGFCPNDQDLTGISLYLETHPGSTAEVVAAARKPDECYVARIQAKEIYALGLSLVYEEDPDGPAGHFVIPELSLSAYQSNKQALKDIQQTLADLGTSNIVHRPPTSA